MAGIDKDTPIPSDIRLRQQSRLVEFQYDSGEAFSLSYEFLRVFTPSAEARGHAPGEETLQTGKRDIDIERVEPVGNYALRFVFSDGHDSGLYSWDILYNLCQHRDVLWAEYLSALEKSGLSRDVDTTSRPKTGGGCSHH